MTEDFFEEEQVTLEHFGADLKLLAAQGSLERAVLRDGLVEEVLTAVTATERRSVVLLGPPGCGKTALVGELAHRLGEPAYEAWSFLRISPSDFLVGTKYLGELETKIRSLVDLIREAEGRVVLYVPNLQELSEAGRAVNRQMSVATALAPHIADGSVTILGETTPEVFQHGLGGIESLRRLFQIVEVEEASSDETVAILKRMHETAPGEQREVVVPEDLYWRAAELADHYLPGGGRPGKAVDLLRNSLRGQSAGATIRFRDLLETLSRSTGLPVTLLDDEEGLDQGVLREFFQSRVMGQAEAVRAVIDVVTLIKAGLTDPERPFGVFLFVGPTGVGKTELARALAEYIFGDPGRLLRLDMSEYASPDAYERLIGRFGTPGVLTSAVRERPFSVVLLDEIEKAHLNVFDLCLQLFDAGRLTEGSGRLVDFRRTIIILTSNVGSEESLSRTAPMGFTTEAREEPPSGASSPLEDLRAYFRPEFLNRLDRVIHFRSLTPEISERIARREVSRVLRRSGIARRQLSVDIDPAAYAVLVRAGYSPAFGARPLKRAVERLVLLPLARSIAKGQLGDGATLRLLPDGDSIRVEIDSSGRVEEDQLPAPARVEGVRESMDELLGDLDRLDEAAAPLTARKSELLLECGGPGFWDDPIEARRALDEVHRLEGILGTLSGLAAAVRRMGEAIDRDLTTGVALDDAADRIEGLRGEARHLGHLLRCRDGRDLGDAIVSLRRVARQGDELDAVERLARMYLGFAELRRLDVRILDDRNGGEPHEDSVVLLVEGGGAFGLLAGEAGLHQVTRRHPENNARSDDREVVEVEVFSVPTEEPDFRPKDLRIEAAPLREVEGRLLERRDLSLELFHEPSLTSIQAWTRGPRDRALAKLELLLRARIESASDTKESAPVARRYTLGPEPRVRDFRSGRSTRRLERVLRGEIGAFLGGVEAS